MNVHHSAAGVSCHVLPGIGDVVAGDDLAGLIDGRRLEAGDIVVVTSKVVSKAEGRVVEGDRSEWLSRESVRELARRGQTAIVRTRHGLVMAAAGVDASNTEPGTLVLLPEDPDRSARELRERLGRDGGPNVAVLVTDTAGRAWRNGQVDIAIGVAGLAPLLDYEGRVDVYGNELAVTEPAVADEVAAAADLVKGKLAQTPVAVVRGLGHLVMVRGDHGPGAAALVRAETGDMFGYGAREAVVAALRGRVEDGPAFGAAAGAEVLTAALTRCASDVVCGSGDGTVSCRVAGTGDMAEQRRLGRLQAELSALAFAHGWTVEPARDTSSDFGLSLRFRAPTP